MFDWLWWLLDSSPFVSHSGEWPQWLIVLSQVSDICIAVAYFLIPVVLCRLWRDKGKELPRAWVLLIFASFFLFCGLGHLWNAVSFYWPAYRLFVFSDVLIACASLATAGLFPPVVLHILSLPSHEQYAKSLEDARLLLHHEATTRQYLQLKVEELRLFADRLERDLQLAREASELRVKLAEIRSRV